MDILTQAKQFATQKHVLDNRQLYGMVLPYTHHLAAVEATLVEYGFTDLDLRTAAWLHDVVEDTAERPNEVRVRDIAEMFGEEIALLVNAVTSEKGESRKIRNALTYPKIRAAGARGIALKLADRIANVKYGIEFGGRALDMYRREYPDFRHALYAPNPGLTSMWFHLDLMLPEIGA